MPHMNRYVLKQKLGEGAFGSVTLATHAETGHDFAIKTLKCKVSGRDAMMALPEVKVCITFNGIRPKSHLVRC